MGTTNRFLGLALMACIDASSLGLMKLSDQVRAAIESSGLTRYRISKETGIAQSNLSRFMGGTQAMSSESLDRLAVVLRISIVCKGPTKAVKARQEGN